jgi:hypothetical protein
LNDKWWQGINKGIEVVDSVSETGKISCLASICSDSKLLFCDLLRMEGVCLYKIVGYKDVS